MTESEPAEPRTDELPEEIREAVPVWADDEYLDRVSDRLMFSYDLERDYAVRGHSFPMYGELRIENQKQFLHPALNYADHETREHLFARRAGEPTVADLERLVDLGHDLADEWVDADEEHYETNFTFVVVADTISDAVRSFVSGFRDRTLLKYGYYGCYEVNLVVVAPDDEDGVASQEADVLQAFALWGDVDTPDEGFFSRLAKRFWT
jgi:hypothetical protein